MKRKLTLKSLLVAALMVMGVSNAWAQTTTTLLEYGTNDVAWTADGLGEWTAGGTPTITDGYVGISGGNGSYATSKTINPTANAIINVQAVWRGRSNTGRAFSAGNGSYFQFGNIIVAQNDQDKKHGYGFTGLDNIGSVTTFAAGSYRVDIANCTWLLIEMEINTASNTLTSFSIKSEDGATTYASASNVVLANADYTTVAFGYKKSGSVKTTNAEQLKSVKITQTTQVVATADYTVKYVCGGTEIKDAAVRTGVVGQEITLTDDDMKNFYADDNSMKYIYESNDSEGKTIAEGDGTVVTVTFREAEKFAWTANSDHGTYSISGETWEGDKASVKYPLYQLVEGKLWKKDAIDKVYAQNFDITENNQELTLTYTETDIDNVVFYKEVEDIAGMTVYAEGNAAARSSLRAVGYSASGKTLVTTLPQGKYKVFASFYSPTSTGGSYKFYTGVREIWATTTDNSNATNSDVEVVLAQESNEILLGLTGATAAVDYIYIQQLEDPTAEELTEAAAADEAASKVTVTLNANGYATFASTSALDLDNILGATAYYASATDGSVVNFADATGTVAAGEGLLLKGEAGATVTIPVAETGSAIDDNLLVGCPTSETLDADASKYVLVGEKFKSLATNGATIPAGKAYLKAPTTARELAISLSETTGINAIENARIENGQFFNLAGQRVAQPTKGLYIVNGKKYVVK